MIIPSAPRATHAQGAIFTNRGWGQNCTPVHTESFVRELLNGFHAVLAQLVERVPGVGVEADAFADDALMVLHVRPASVTFALPAYRQPIAGLGLVLGTGEDGEAVSAQMTLEELRRSILHLRIVRVEPIRFLAWEGTREEMRATTLEEIEAWIQDLPPPTLSPSPTHHSRIETAGGLAKDAAGIAFSLARRCRRTPLSKRNHGRDREIARDLINNRFVHLSNWLS